MESWMDGTDKTMASSAAEKSHRRSSYFQGDLLPEDSSNRFTIVGQTTTCDLGSGPEAAFGKADQGRRPLGLLHVCALSTSSLLKLVVQMLLSGSGPYSYQEGSTACPSPDR